LLSKNLLGIKRIYTHYLNAPTAQEPVFSVILRGPFVFDFSGPSSASSSTLTANDGCQSFSSVGEMWMIQWAVKRAKGDKK